MEWNNPDDRLLQTLREMMARQPEIEGVAVVSIDGAHIASILPQRIRGKRLIAASLAALASLGTKLAAGSGRKPHDTQVYVKAEFGYVLVLPFNEKWWLVVLCGPQAKLGSIFSGLLGSGGVPHGPRSPAPEPIIPRTPPGRLSARAKLEYDDEE